MSKKKSDWYYLIDVIFVMGISAFAGIGYLNVISMNSGVTNFNTVLSYFLTALVAGGLALMHVQRYMGENK